MKQKEPALFRYRTHDALSFIFRYNFNYMNIMCHLSTLAVNRISTQRNMRARI